MGGRTKKKIIRRQNEQSKINFANPAKKFKAIKTKFEHI